MTAIKKIFLLLLMILTVSGYGGESQDKISAEPDKVQSVDKTPVETFSADKKILVVYFSRTGEEYNVGNPMIIKHSPNSRRSSLNRTPTRHLPPTSTTLSGDFLGKTIIPFCTHGGSGLAATESEIADACPNAKILQGLAISGRVAQNDSSAVEKTVDEWLNTLRPNI